MDIRLTVQESGPHRPLDGVQTDSRLQASAQPPALMAIVLAMITVYLVWGSSYFAMHVAVETIPPFLMAGTRFLIAGFIAYAWARSHGAGKPSRREVIDGFVAGTLMLVVGTGSVAWAVKTVHSGLVALVVASVPMWIAVLGWLRPGSPRPDLRTVLSLLLGMAGVACLMGPANLLESQADPDAGVPIYHGVVLVLASLSWAAGSLYTRARAREARREPFLKTAALQMLSGGSLLLVISLACGEFTSLNSIPLSLEALSAPDHLWAAAAMGYLIVAGSVLGYTTYGWLLTVVRPTLAATYTFVSPVVAVVLGCLLENESLSAMELLSGGMIICAVALMVLARPVGENCPRNPGLRAEPEQTISNEPVHAEDVMGAKVTR